MESSTKRATTSTNEPETEPLSIESIIQGLSACVEREKAQLLKDREQLRCDREALEKDREEFEISLRRVAENQSSITDNRLVRVDVGGRIFMLCPQEIVEKFPVSYFGALFSGRWRRNNKPTPGSADGVEGAIFIDRSGTLFHRIADFMRYYGTPFNYNAASDLTASEREQLMHEAEFYRLVPLMEEMSKDSEIKREKWTWLHDGEQPKFDRLNDGLAVRANADARPSKQISVDGSLVMSSGIHEWSLLINYPISKIEYGYPVFMVGVTPVGADQDNYCGFTVHSCGAILSFDTFYDDRDGEEYFFPRITSPVTVTLRLDMDALTLTLRNEYIKSAPVTITLRDYIAGTSLIPTVGLRHKGASVVIL